MESLCRALRLPDIERERLFLLAGQFPPGNGAVRSRVTPSVQRLLDRLANTPVVVYDAAWDLVVANAPYEALMGDTSTWHGIERNNVWRNLVGPGTRAVHTAQEQAELEANFVADLRLTAARYPADRRLRGLVQELSARSPRFVELWESTNPEPHRDPSRRKIIDHPAVGRIELDCDTLIVAADDLRITVYTAEPGSADAERLALAIVLGTQELTGRSAYAVSKAPRNGLSGPGPSGARAGEATCWPSSSWRLASQWWCAAEARRKGPGSDYCHRR